MHRPIAHIQLEKRRLKVQERHVSPNREQQSSNVASRAKTETEMCVRDEQTPLRKEI